MSGIRILGGQSLNFFILKNVIDDDTEINTIAAYDDNIEWTYNMNLFAAFNNNLDAGSINNLSEIINSWRIYRRTLTETQNKLVGEVDSSISSIKDYCISNKNEYTYSIIGTTDNYISDVIESDIVSTDFYNWSLTGVLSHDIFKFRLNVEEGNIAINSNISIVVNNSQYPVISKSKSKYKSGNPNALIGDLQSDGITYVDTIDMRERLINFLNNDEQKLLKSLKGDLLLVDTYTNDFSIDNKTNEQEQTVNFSWLEVGSIDDLSVFDEIST